MIFLDWIGKGGDPFWDQVLLLLPFSDSGTTFTDYGPLANAVNFDDAGFPVMGQNSVWTHFGGNTLQNVTASGVQNSINVLNTASALGPGDDLCIEYQYLQRSASAATTAPLHVRFDQVNESGILVAQRVSTYTTAPVSLTDATFRALANGPFFTGPIAFNFGAVKTVAIQIVAADAMAYVYIDGAQVDSFVCGLGTSLGWLVTIGEPTAGGTANTYDISLSGLRITRADRYGNQPTIPVPSEPWPIGP